jgi:hypothetical protein
MEVALLPVKPGSLSAKDKAALAEAGVVVIEHETPETLRLLRPTAELDASDMLECALRALCDGNIASTSVQALFARHVGAAYAAKKKA